MTKWHSSFHFLDIQQEHEIQLVGEIMMDSPSQIYPPRKELEVAGSQQQQDQRVDEETVLAPRVRGLKG